MGVLNGKSNSLFSFGLHCYTSFHFKNNHYYYYICCPFTILCIISGAYILFCTKLNGQMNEFELFEINYNYIAITVNRVLHQTYDHRKDGQRALQPILTKRDPKLKIVIFPGCVSLSPHKIC